VSIRKKQNYRRETIFERGFFTRSGVFPDGQAPFFPCGLFFLFVSSSIY